jgi:Papain family cysteine protease
MSNDIKSLADYFYFVRCSWGPKWGETGFVRMLRNQNLCGIGEEPNYPVLKTNPPKPLTPIKAPTDCLIMGQVFKEGAYVKSYCVDNYGQTYDGAQESGLSQGMRLYSFDSPEAISTLINGVTTEFFDYSDFNIRVNGKSATQCSNINNVNRLLKKFSNGTSSCTGTTRTAYEFVDVACM